MMHLVLASGNKGKLAELSALFSPLGVLLTAQAELGIKEIPETGLSFIENALLKARHASQVSGLPAVADDSGLCVDALEGAPGIYSARYAGARATDKQNNDKLISALHNVEDRSAHFVCVLVFIKSATDPFPTIASCSWQGRIVDQPGGENGFGYDPYFYLDEHACTAAQLPAEKKNAVSHRGQACRELLSKLQNNKLFQLK
ncbi:MAG: RdgB/HAM1 family non-canonical purine NTP pyrophosphatase [Pseudomonadales bacterium]|nr:RdgB/HAM1 family non-canonical purine NTP pyrophosphatase [Pseudomonadales bacterium]